MRKLQKPTTQTKPMKVLNKSLSSTQQIPVQKPNLITSQYIEDPEKLLRINKQQIVLMIKDQLHSIHLENTEIKSQMKKITQQLHQERNLNSQIISNVKADIVDILDKIEIKEYGENNERKTVVDNKRLTIIQANMNIVFQKLDQIGQGGRISLAPDQRHLQQFNNINNNVEEVGIEMRSITREIQRQVAQLHDSFVQLEQTVHTHINTVGDKMRLYDLQKAVDILNSQIGLLSTTSQKSTADLQKIFRQIQHHEFQIQKSFSIQQKLQAQFETSISNVKQFTQLQSGDLQQFLSNRLGKMIQSYNNNFQQMDKSISDLKETVKQVLYINRLISDNLGHKLRNIIDNNTFNQTITDLHQKFNQSYMMNHQKIQQLNSKDYQVENEINYMKDILENLKLDMKQNYSKKAKLNEEVSLSSSSDHNLQRSLELAQMRGFKKPNYVFPERDSFNFTQQKKRRSLGVDEDFSSIRISKDC